MAERVFVAGVGMTKFEGPGRPREHEAPWDYPSMARESGQLALADAGVEFSDIQQAIAGYVYGESCCGQRAVYELGETGIPIFNLNSNCSSGSSALAMAAQLIRGGVADCVLVIGFEKMQPGSLAVGDQNRESPIDRTRHAVYSKFPSQGAPFSAELFGFAGREHMQRYGTTAEHFGMIAEKNHRHSEHNSRAQFQDVYTLDEIMRSTRVAGPLTKLMCSPTSDGSAAAVLMSEREVERRGIAAQAIEILAQQVVTDFPTSFDGSSAIAAVGSELTTAAARGVYESTGLGPENIDVIELHDCFATNELFTYEALGLCGPGEGGTLIEKGDTTHGGRWVVNPSGGLIAKGHPLGATGLAQCAEITWQLRGQAERRQVADARIGLAHNLGLGGAAVVTMYHAPTP